jgi:hypothetical protein
MSPPFSGFQEYAKQEATVKVQGHVAPKRRFISNALHGFMSQKIELFIYYVVI